MSRKILIVAAHPDDEVLGCGGTIARHASEGDEVYVVFMADGVNARIDSEPKSVERRNEAAENAARLLGITELHFLGLPDNRLDGLPLLDIVQPLESHIRAIQPEVIYTHHHGDLNVDHRLTHQAVMTACRPQPGLCVKEIYAFEVLSSTEWQTPGYRPFEANVYVDVGGYINAKRAALVSYDEEMREEPHSRSIENAIRQAQLRGNAVGLDYAEAFVLLRGIRRL